jgi:hypothetical protein
MRAIFGVVSLLVALAIVGIVITNQLKSVKQVAAPVESVTGVPPALSASGSLGEQSRQLQDKVVSDLAKAAAQGAAARQDAIEK